MKRIKQSAEKQQGGMWFKDPQKQIHAGQKCGLRTCQTLFLSLSVKTQTETATAPSW